MESERMLIELEGEMLSCRRCETQLRAYGLEPRPIFQGGSGFPIFLLGQAPGRTEYDRRAPFQGDAGKAIKDCFAACGLSRVEGCVYQTSVTKCFPGRKPGRSVDRRPSGAEVSACLPFLRRQIYIVKPKLLVCLGGLAWEAFLRMREAEEPGYCRAALGLSSPRLVTLPDMVGRKFEWAGMVVLPMIHPSGTANGARAMHPNLDRASKELLAKHIADLGIDSSPASSAP